MEDRMPQWEVNFSEMKDWVAQAKASGHTRLCALVLDGQTSFHWSAHKDEQAVKQYLASREESLDPKFYNSIAVLVIDVADSEEKLIRALALPRSARRGRGSGYHEESFGKF